jgi:hypothetical protein
MTVPCHLGRCRDRDGSRREMTGFLKMKADTTKTGIHSPGSRSGTSRIVAQPEEQKNFFYSPFIIVPDMAEGCDSAFIGETLVTCDQGSDRAGNDRNLCLFARNPLCNVEGRTGGQKGSPIRPTFLDNSGCRFRPCLPVFSCFSYFSCCISLLSCCLIFGRSLGKSLGKSFGTFSGWSLP